MIPFIDAILGRMACPAHDGQVVQSFCKRRQCLKYLCSKCQMLHTQQHNAIGSLPDYQSIQITITKCQELLSEQIKKTQKSKRLLKKEQENWERKKRKMFGDLDKIEQVTIEETVKNFTEIRNNLTLKIRDFQHSVGIQQGQNFDDLYEIYEKQIENLQKCKNLLKKQNSCAQLKSILGEIIPRTEENMKKMTQIALSNLNQNLSLNVDTDQLFSWLKAGLINRVGLNFNDFNHTIVKTTMPNFIPPQNLITQRQQLVESTPINIYQPPNNYQKVVMMGKQGNLKNKIQNNISSSVIFTHNTKKGPSIAQRHEVLPMRRSSLFGKSARPQLRY